MDRGQLYEELNYVNHSRENRKKYAQMVIADPGKMVPMLLDIAFDKNDKNSHRACWLLEFVARENLAALYPYLDLFTLNMQHVFKDPAVRPIAKICEYLVEDIYVKKNPKTIENLKARHKERITELCFDYLITDQKIAPKAYSMQCLYLLGTEYDWIHPELKQVLERIYPNTTNALQCRIRKILDAIKNRSNT